MYHHLNLCVVMMMMMMVVFDVVDLAPRINPSLFCI